MATYLIVPSSGEFHAPQCRIVRHEHDVPDALQACRADYQADPEHCDLERLRIDAADLGPGLRWFIQRDGRTWRQGFRTKLEASAWIDSHGTNLDWRVGFLFHLRGDTRDIQIVNRHGNLAKP